MLDSYLSIKRELRQLQERIEELQHAKEDIKSPTWSDMPRGGHENQSKIETVLILLEEQQEMYFDKYKELLEVQKDIEELIKYLEPIEREVMRYKYFEGKTFEEIALMINFSYRTVRRIHKRSLEKLDDFGHHKKAII